MGITEMQRFQARKMYLQGSRNPSWVWEFLPDFEHIHNFSVKL